MESTYHYQCPAYLMRIVELGEQPATFNAQTKGVYKILLSWVVPSRRVMVGGTSKPLIIHNRYTFSLFDKSHLYRDIQSMRGREFDEYEIGTQFDILTLLGQNCVLTLSEVLKKDKTDFVHQLIGIQPLAEDELEPDKLIAPHYLIFSDFDWDIYQKLGTGLKQSIASSPQFQQVLERKKQRDLMDEAPYPGL